MKRSKRFKTLVDVAKHRELDAAVAMAESRRTVASEKEKLETLETFLHDYEKRFDARRQTGIHVRELSQYHSMMQRVNESIEQQTIDWQNAEAELTDLKNAWKSAYQDTHKMGKVMRSAMLDESRLQEKRAQNEMDDRPRRRSKSR